MEKRHLTIDVLPGELEKLEELKGDKTWRELILPPLGIPAKRRTPGPPRKRHTGSEEVPPDG